MNTAVRIVCVMLVVAALTSCKTGKSKPVETPEETAAGFQPGAFLTPIRHEQGRYADLYSPNSFALWIGPEVLQFKQEMAKEAGETADPKMDADAQRIAQDFLVLECHIESAFSDSSIAYDVVGFRGMDDVYLLLPGGKKVHPQQTVIGPRAEEEGKGALKVFRRTNLLVFPRHDLWSGGATLDPTAPSVKLVLEGYASHFYFEWPAAPGSPVAQKWSPAAEDAKRAVIMGYTQFMSSVRRLAHMFD
ncbi:MAG: hypothetical protein HZB26_26285 [Candidatus Hydrogenedentes bacterium]|nr:hypothetical protein [Candidatus Hydrogenedentota bacterium]